MNKTKSKFVNKKSSVVKKKIVKEESSGPYTVIKLREKKDTTLFDCIPDNWFVDENRDRCFWPPPKGKNVAIRALKREEPDDTWEIYDCEVVTGGIATYSVGRALVREKCLQNYNTSSADEYLEAMEFRREHPGISCLTLQSFEEVFAVKKTGNSSAVNCETENRASVADKPPLNDGNVEIEHTQENNTQLAHIGKRNESKKVLSFEDDDVQQNMLPVQLVSDNTQKVSSRNSSPTALVKHMTICRRYRDTASHEKRQRASPKRRRSESRSGSSVSRSISGKNDRSPSCSSGGSRRIQDTASHEKRQCASPKRRRSESRSGNSNNRSRVSSGRSDRSASCSSPESPRIITNPKKNNRSPQQIEHCQSPRTTYAPSNQDGRQNFTVRRRQQRRASPKRRRSESRSGHSAAKHHRRSRSVDSPSPSIEARQQHSPFKTIDKNLASGCSSSKAIQNQRLLKSLKTEVRCLTKTVAKNQHENDRRLSRMEVSINKTLVRLGDITRSNDDSRYVRDHSGERLQRGVRKDAGRYERSDHSSERIQCRVRKDAHRYERGDSPSYREHRRGNTSDPRLPIRHRFPEMPIEGLSELNDANVQFMDKDFSTSMVEQEKEFCAPSKKQSVTATITTYLKRFVSVRTRSLLTLNQNEKGFTLYGDFRNVYNFLMRVMVEGYKSSKTRFDNV